MIDMKLDISLRNVFLMVVSSLLLTLPCRNAQAGQGWICSITEAVECVENGECGPPDLGGIEPPTFFRVDIDKKEITILAPESRRGEVTKIDIVRQQEDLWLLTGVEEERAWSMVITDSGHMTLALAVDGNTFTVFGKVMKDE
jgi:hypothetical protein